MKDIHNERQNKGRKRLSEKKALAFVAAIRERKDGADRTKGWDFPMALPARCIGIGKRKSPILVRPSCATVTAMKNISFRSNFDSPTKLYASNSVP